MSGCTAPSIISSRPLARPSHSRQVLALQRCVSINRNLTSNRNSRPIQARAILPRVIAGCGAAAVSLFVPLLPSWASEFLDDAYLDPSVAESPDLLGTLLIVVVTYFTVMMLYLWLSSFWDEDAVHGSGSSNQQPLDKSDVPPGYGSFLDAHVRSYVEPAGGERQVRVLSALDEVTAPLEGEDLQQLKARLAAGAAEALDQQIRDIQLLVRTKLLARKLGYTQANAKLGKTGTSSDGGCGSFGEVATADIAGLLTTAVLNTPGGLNSCQCKAAIDALVDKELERQLPPGGGPWHDDLVVRGVMRRVVNALVMEESLLLLEGVDKGRRALEAAGRIQQDSRNKWALW